MPPMAILAGDTRRRALRAARRSASAAVVVWKPTIEVCAHGTPSAQLSSMTCTKFAGQRTVAVVARRKGSCRHHDGMLGLCTTGPSVCSPDVSSALAGRRCHTTSCACCLERDCVSVGDAAGCAVRDGRQVCHTLFLSLASSSSQARAVSRSRRCLMKMRSSGRLPASVVMICGPEQKLSIPI